MRFGGDEFFYAQSGVDIADTRIRFVRVNADLAAAGSGAISVGVADLREGDSVEALIARADAAMYATRAPDPLIAAEQRRKGAWLSRGRRGR